jgi:hypothetical protein
LVAYTFRLEGALDVPLLERAINEVVRRHDALRARIVLVDAMPMTLIEEAGTYALGSVELQGDSTAKLEAHARRWIAAFTDRRIDPLLGPLLLIRLIRLRQHEHWLVLALHRLIADCASIEQVFKEIWTLYSEWARGQQPSLTTSPKQYSDYAIRQQQTDAEWRRRHESYWSGRLAGAEPVHWPMDTPLSGKRRGLLGRMSTRFGEALSAGLRELARRERTLLANVVLAVYIAVLSRWCNQKDFVVPFFVAGRQSEHRSVIGYFSHLLYIRITLSGEETFSELLAHVGNELFRAFSHQDFGRLAIQAPHLLTGAFCQWITWHTGEVAGMKVPTPEDVDVPTADRVVISDFAEDLTALPAGSVDVEVSFFDTAEGIYASGVYRADLFEAGTWERFMHELHSASEEFVRDPRVRVARTPVKALQEGDGHECRINQYAAARDAPGNAGR